MSLAEGSANIERKIKLTLQLERRYQDMIRTDSKATFFTQGLLGGRGVEIQRGYSGVPIKASDEVPFVAERQLTGIDIVELLRKFAKQETQSPKPAPAKTGTVLAGGLAGSTDYNGLAALADYGCYDENGTVIVPPAQGTFGNMGRNIFFNGLPFREWDLSVVKTWKIKERLSMEFRAEAFNVTNTPIHSPPNVDPSTAPGNSGDPILGTGGPRQFTFYLKMIF